jgi:Big-like domain-containing protein
MGRGMRLELVAGLGIALALPALARSAGTTIRLGTETTLGAETRDLGGRTQATLTVSVTGKDGQPATGAVVIEDGGKPLAGVELNSEGHATSVLTLAPGAHRLTATYAGDTSHLTSVSQVSPVSAVTGTAPDFSIAVAPATLSLAEGQSGGVTASITPINASSLSGPMFVTLSCAGLPDQSTCTFTPENLEIQVDATAAVTSNMVIATAASGAARVEPPQGIHPNRVAWAILLPGAFGLMGLAFGARRRAWLSRLSLLALVGLVTVLGTTGCNPLYYYKNHGPPPNLPTPVGTYTLNVTAQSSNGVTATTHTTTMVLTVTQ